VNIQHLESLNDKVQEITGIRVRETFPDRLLDEADEVVLTDLPPDALRSPSRRSAACWGRSRPRPPTGRPWASG
jgi:two-component system, OmpR family, sensor histidine kinase KdpD